MEITKENVVTIKEPTHDILVFCQKQLVLENPKYASNERMGISNFATSDTLQYYNYDKESNLLHVPIGFWERHFSTVKTIDKRVDFKSDIISTLKRNYILRQDQQEAVDKMLPYTNGILSAPTSFGKSVVATEIIKQRMQKTLFLVHTKELASQFQSMLRIFLGYEAGLIGTGRFELTDIAVGIIQTLVRLNKDQMDCLNNTYSHIIGDEIHQYSADTYFEAMSKLKGKFKLGMSATPERSDGKTDVVIYATGPIRHIVELKNIKDKVTIPTFEYIYTDFDFPIFNSREYSKLLEYMAKDSNRNQLIVDARNKYPNKFAVILCQRIEHMVILQKLIPNSKVLHSGIKTSDRKDILKDFANKKFNTIISSFKLMGVGIDLKNIDLLIFAGPTNSKIDTKQAIGRSLRKDDTNPNKESLVIDIIDKNVGMLAGMARNRKKLYKEYIEINKESF